MSGESSSGQSGNAIDPSFVRRFERRAAAHGWLAGGVLVLIAALVAFAVFVFFNAANITSSDFRRDSSVLRLDQQSIDLLEAEVETLRTLRDHYADQYESGMATNVDLADVDLQVHASQRRLAFALLRDKAGRPLGTDLDRPNSALAEELEPAIELMEMQKATLNRHLAIVEELEESGRFLQSGVALIQSWQRATEIETNLLKSQLAQVKKNGEDPELATDLDVSSYVPLIQISLTRFGTMVVIFFFISILVPLYRYNMRLRVFYNSLADALLLTRDTELSLAELAPVLSPEWGFDAPPETPTQHAAQVFERVVGAARKA